MESGIFKEEFSKLKKWFKIKLDKNHEYQLYTSLHGFPTAAFQYAVSKLLEERKPIPSNFPTVTELKCLMAEWFHENPTARKGSYNKNEDYRYPIANLNKAFSILETRGKDAFINYCNQTNMPKNDRERVWNKHIYIQKHKKHPDQKSILKQIMEHQSRGNKHES